MVKNMIVGAVIASQAFICAAHATPARPKAVSFESAKLIDHTGGAVRLGTSVKRKNDLAGAPFLLPLLGVAALVAVVAVVASGGDDDSSPN